ncbi:MAG: site-specific integrase [Nitrincola lacisaponensis]|uniref:site-specific integrase n=1 Tax=Nitrincola lacisaponensis TaxID=267850 RepID=UPI00391BD1F9
MASQIPFTYRRDGIYYARFRLPHYLLAKTQQLGLSCDIRFSLNTHKAKIAKNKILEKSSFFYKYIDKYFTHPIISDDSQFKSRYEELIAHIKRKELIMQPELLHNNNLPAQQHHLFGQTHGHDFSFMDHYTFPPFHLKYSLLVNNTLTLTENKAFVETLDNGQFRVYSDAHDPDLAATEIAAVYTAFGGGGGNGGGGSNRTGITLLTALNSYITTMTKACWAKENTADQNSSRLQKIVDFFGSTTDTGLITLDEMERFENDLLERVNVNSERRGKKKTDNTLAVSTAKAYMILAKGFFRWCFKKRYFKTNLADCMGDLLAQSTPRKKNRNPYASFTFIDLEKIFGRYLFVNEDISRSRKMLDTYFWAPVIGCFTGMRLNEICQLKVEDIQCENGIWFINTDDLSEGQSTKNEFSKRQIPLHKELIRIGLLDFYHERKQLAGQTGMLFKDLKWDKKNQWIKETSRWFCGESGLKGHLDQVDLSIRNKKVFHSFRHTFIKRMRKLRVPTTDIAAVVGHEAGLTTERYGGEYELDTLKAIIDKLEYPVDFSHISYEHYRLYQLTNGRPKANSHLIKRMARHQPSIQKPAA